MDYFIFGLLVVTAGGFYVAHLIRMKDSRLSCEGSEFVLESYKLESPIEWRLYNALYRNGVSVKTQVQCGPYRIDLAIPSHMIAIECDGAAYHSSVDQRARDRRKDKYLRKHGWIVLRFSGKQITKDVCNPVKRVLQALGE